MSSSPTLLAPLLTTSARLPSGVIATATGSAGGGVVTAGVGWVATDTVPTGFTFLPSIASTVTESSARLATSATVPARLSPACLRPPSPGHRPRNLSPVDYAKLSVPASQRDGTLRSIRGFAPRPVATSSLQGLNGKPTLLIPG